jgi:hypothetical protein
MGDSLLRFVGQVATVALTVTAIHWLRTAKGSPLPRTRADGTSVYGIKSQWKAVGLISGMFAGVLAAMSSHHLDSIGGWVSIIFFVALALSGLWLASGSVSTDPVGIKKTLLWRSHSLRWDEMTEIRLLSKDIGAIDLRAGSRKTYHRIAVRRVSTLVG